MSWHDVLIAFHVGMLAYFAALNLNYLVLLVLGWRETSDFVRRRALRDYDTVADSELSTPVSILVPAHDEEPIIVDSVRALLAVRYRRVEVIVVNDGSRDGTIDALISGFSLVRVERVPRAQLETAPVRAVYVCPGDPRLVVVDKENAGKADALNAGLAFARYPLFCAVDSDTMLERDALARLVWQFQQQPETVATGGIVRIVNGSTVADAAVLDVRTSRDLLVNVQIVEYLRAFLTGRTGWSRLGMLLIVSGAFGLFRRETVIAAGGYDISTVGEDAELVFRLHRHCRELKRPYRISFVADPVCWTEAPSSLRVLRRQRDRWQRGLIESIVRHRGMLLRPRYGRIGLIGLPYFIVFEMLGPVIEVVGYAVMTGSAAAGVLAPTMFLLFFGVAVAFGLILSFGALRIEERAFQRYGSWRCVGRLAVAAAVENFGYRQLNALVRAAAFWTLLRRSAGWGEMRRVGFEPALETVDAATPGAVTATPPRLGP